MPGRSGGGDLEGGSLWSSRRLASWPGLLGDGGPGGGGEGYNVIRSSESGKVTIELANKLSCSDNY